MRNFFNHGWTRMNTDGNAEFIPPGRTNAGSAPEQLATLRNNFRVPSVSVSIRVHPWLNFQAAL